MSFSYLVLVIFLDFDFLTSHRYLDVAENGGQGLTELERESPPYDVLCASENGYEARQYHKALWVITFSDPGEEFLAAKLRCESKIQNYILGHNERGKSCFFFCINVTD